MRWSLVALVGLLAATGCTIEDASSGEAVPVSGGSNQNQSGPAGLVASFPQEGTVGITSDGTHVFVTVVATEGNGGSVLRLGDDGALTLAVVNDEPWGVVADDTFVYFSSIAGGVSRVEKSGGSLPVLLTNASTIGATGVAVSGDYVYFASSDGIHRVSKTGGDDTLWVADKRGTDAVVADAAEVFWIDRGTDASPASGGVMRADIATGATTALADGLTLGSLSTFTLAQGLDTLFFPDTENNRVYRISKIDGSVTTISTGSEQPIAVASDNTNVFVVDESFDSTGPRSIGAAGTGGAASTRSLTGNASTSAFAVAVDDHYIWYTNYFLGYAGGAINGAIYRINKDGSAPTTTVLGGTPISQ